MPWAALSHFFLRSLGGRLFHFHPSAPIEKKLEMMWPIRRADERASVRQAFFAFKRSHFCHHTLAMLQSKLRFLLHVHRRRTHTKDATKETFWSMPQTYVISPGTVSVVIISLVRNGKKLYYKGSLALSRLYMCKSA
jgi:hypothetical protein